MSSDPWSFHHQSAGPLKQKGDGDVVVKCPTPQGRQSFLNAAIERNDDYICCNYCFKEFSTIYISQKMFCLHSSEEQADTIIVFHAIDLAQSHDRIIVRCDDTDVLVVLGCYASKGCLGKRLYMHDGHSNKMKYIPVCDIAKSTLSACQPCML